MKQISLTLLLCITLSAPILGASNHKSNEKNVYDGSFNRQRRKYPDIYYTLKVAGLVTGSLAIICSAPSIWRKLNDPHNTSFERFRVALGGTNNILTLARNMIKLFNPSK
jgi:hypothetical protein